MQYMLVSGIQYHSSSKVLYPPPPPIGQPFSAKKLSKIQEICNKYHAIRVLKKKPRNKRHY